MCLFVKPLIYCFNLAALLKRQISCFIPSLLAWVRYYNLVLVLFPASFSMHYLSQLDRAWHHLTSFLDYLRFLKGQQNKKTEKRGRKEVNMQPGNQI